MMNYRRLAPLVSALSLVTMPVHADEPPPCQPTFVRVSEEPISVRVNPLWEIGFEAVAIGCELELAALDDGTLVTVRERLEEVAKEKHIGLEQFAADPAFTRTTAEEINDAIGQEAISDLFFFNFSFTEYAPVDESVEDTGGGDRARAHTEGH